MPTYQYQCRDCGHTFEQFQKFSENPVAVCPACGGPVQRVIQNVGVVFKGSGWYINDSRTPAPSAPSNDAAPAGGSTDSTSKTRPGPETEKAPVAASAAAKSD